MLTTQIPVRDMMQTGVITLSTDATLESAVRTLEEHRISGAPVIDELGHVVGVLSASDIANTSRLEDGQLAGSRGTYYLADRFADEGEPEDFRMDGYNADSAASSVVRDLMTPQVLSVKPDLPLAEACRVMVQERVHRVLVTEQGALVGILSSFDVVRALAATS